jgi:virginiamycin B lyase
MARLALLLLSLAACAAASAQEISYYEVPTRSGPHDVAPAPDGTVWFTAQRSGHLGRLDPATSRAR